MKRLGLCAAVAVALFCSSLWARPAIAERRVAFIIGNSAYQNAPKLPNPDKDAKAIAEAFQKAGFNVVQAQYDLGYLQFSRAIRQFQDIAIDADIAVIYYAGHGAQIDGTNYLVPVDAEVDSSEAASQEAIKLDELQKAIGRAKRLQLIILDACRDNPFAAKVAQRGLEAGGLAPVNPATMSGDSLIAFAAEAGHTALDGQDGHSPFALALLHNLFVPGRAINLAFTGVRDEVMKHTHNQQVPFVFGSLGADAIALVPGTEQAPIEVDRDAKRDFDLVDEIEHGVSSVQAINAWKVFLKSHPSGPYAERAKKKLGDLEQQVASLAPIAPPAPAITDDQRAWERVRDSHDIDALNAFIAEYPHSLFAPTAETMVKTIKDQQRLSAEREALRKQLDDAKKLADEAVREKAERDAAAKRAQESAEAADQAQRNAAAEAAEKRREEVRQQKTLAAAQAAAKAAELARKQAAAEAAKKRQEEAQQQKALAAAQAQKKAQDEAEKAAALERAKQAAAKEAEKANKEAEAEAEAKRAEAAHQAALAEVARQKQETACKTEQDRLTSLEAVGRGARGDLTQFEQGLTCERLRPLVTAALERASAMPNVNTPDQVRLAQKQLIRLGCYSNAADGTLNDDTRAAVRRYAAASGKPARKIEITDEYVAELTKHSARVCPLVCPAGEISRGEHCIAAEKLTPVVRQKDERSKTATKRETREEEQKKSARQRRDEKGKVARREEAGRNRRQSEPRPRVTQEASRGHGGGSGSGSGSGGATIGVGF